MVNINKFNQIINGTRGVAVLLVLLFHLELVIFKGGFTGVDVFFVISGYLISSKIIPSIDNSSFKFNEYILRRLKRILPSYFFVIIASLIVILLLFVDIHKQYSLKEILFSLFFFQNFYYWDQSGYFGLEKLYKPLLNTWSLGIEVQFYLLFPLLYFILKKKIIILIILSFLLSYFYGDRNISYFILPTRFFEFGIGIIVYLILSKKKFKDKKSTNFFFLVGIILVFFSTIYIDQNKQFPGFYTLFPCIGTGLIIYNSLKTKYSFLIDNNFFNFFGNISYSLYLIHWPLIIFYKYLFIKINLHFIDQIIIFLFSIIAAYALTFYYEITFYKKKLKPVLGFNKFLILYLILIIVIFSIFYILQKKIKIIEDNIIIFDEKIILQQENSEEQKKILILGDSHGLDLYRSLISNNNFTKKSKFIYIDLGDHCFQSYLNQDNLITQLEILIYKKLNTVYKQCNSKILEFKNSNILNIANTIIISNRYNKTSLKYLIPFAEKVKNEKNKVVIVNNGPRFIDPRTLVKLNKNLSIEELNKKFYLFQDKLIVDLNDSMKKISKSKDIFIFDKYGLICNKFIKSCSVLDSNNEFLFSDKDHFSLNGYRFYGNKLFEFQIYSLF